MSVMIRTLPVRLGPGILPNLAVFDQVDRAEYDVGQAEAEYPCRSQLVFAAKKSGS